MKIWFPNRVVDDVGTDHDEPMAHNCVQDNRTLSRDMSRLGQKTLPSHDLLMHPEFEDTCTGNPNVTAGAGERVQVRGAALHCRECSCVSGDDRHEAWQRGWNQAVK